MIIEGSTLGILSYTLQPMFDRVLVGRDADAVWLIGGAIMALFCIRAVAGVSQRIILTRVGQLSTTQMQADLVSHVMRLDSLFFHDNPPGALMERVQGDTTVVQQVWKVLIQGAARDAVALISLGIVAVSIDLQWALTALIGIPALILPAMVLQRYIRRKARSMRQISAKRSTRLSEIFQGIDPIKLNRLEDYQSGRFRSLIDQIVRTQIRTDAGAATLPGLLDVMTGVGFFAVLVLGGQDILSGEKTVGQFMSFFTAMALAFQPLRRLATMAGVLQTTAASLERIYTLFDLKPGITSAPGAVAAPKDTTIDFDDVQFAYADHPVLNGATFTAKAGETTALVGASGAGKSTVFSLLTRLIERQSGTITVGGTPLETIDLGALRDLYSVVAQDALLFDETLRENVVLGRSDIDDARLSAAIDAAHLTEFLASQPQGLEMPAGPRGSNLSGGQRQRVAIARAVLRDAPILLLDEATSALDAKSEAAVQAALEELSHGRTTLVIAHRLSTIRAADKIVVLDRGRVVDQGTHDELLARDGIYAGLYRLQFEET
ncbi:MAG: ABC transporter ATP-binding protein [Rhodobacteraceae bacterium]|nr:ABC transporter ATP-binding protein [Paracoccaceae bacterium]